MILCLWNTGAFQTRLGNEEVITNGERSCISPPGTGGTVLGRGSWAGASRRLKAQEPSWHLMKGEFPGKIFLFLRLAAWIPGLLLIPQSILRPLFQLESGWAGQGVWIYPLDMGGFLRSFWCFQGDSRQPGLSLVGWPHPTKLLRADRIDTCYPKRIKSPSKKKKKKPITETDVNPKLILKCKLWDPRTPVH